MEWDDMTKDMPSSTGSSNVSSIAAVDLTLGAKRSGDFVDTTGDHYIRMNEGNYGCSYG